MSTGSTPHRPDADASSPGAPTHSAPPTAGSHAVGAGDARTTAPGYADDVSIGDRLGIITEDLSTLMRQEIALAKAEAAVAGKKAGTGAGMLGGAGVAAHLMLIFLSLAAAWGLGALGMGLGWGALIVGIVWGVVAAVLALVGKKKFENLGMPQTVDTAQRIPDAMKGNETA